MEHGREREPVVGCRSAGSSCVLSRFLNLLDNISPRALPGWRERTMAFWKRESSAGPLLGHADSTGQSRQGWAEVKLMTQGGHGPCSEAKVWAWG